MQLRKYEFNQQDKSIRTDTQDVTDWLESQNYLVKNVEKNSVYRFMDIDLLAFEGGRIHWIELKVDRVYHSGNYFFETISNCKKQTPGCFLVTQSHFLFYYFPQKRELHIMNTKEARKWFLANQSTFKTKRTCTIGRDGEEFYQTEGCLVNREMMKNCVYILVIKI